MFQNFAIWSAVSKKKLVRIELMITASGLSAIRNGDESAFELENPHPGKRPIGLIHAIFIVVYLTGMLSLVNTAHQGGTLVHGLGVHAMMGPNRGQ